MGKGKTGTLTDEVRLLLPLTLFPVLLILSLVHLLFSAAGDVGTDDQVIVEAFDAGSAAAARKATK